MKTDQKHETPWQVLGLSSSTASLADVKSTYARLLKIHRPDRDPEGFMRLRAAYDAAQLEIKERAGAEKSMTMPSEQRLVPKVETWLAEGSQPPATQPPEVMQSIAELRRAVASKARQKVRIAWTAYEETAARHPGSPNERWELFIDAFQGHVEMLADACTDELILGQLKLGKLQLLRLVTEVWGRRGDAKRLDEFCVSLSRQRTLAESETGAHAMVVAALALGPWNPDLASRLAQRAFPRLPTSQRNELTALIDMETMIGRLVGPLPNGARQPWMTLLRHGDHDRPWKEVISRDMLITLLRFCGPQWPGFAVLARRLSAQSWTEMKAVLEALLR